MYLLRAKPPQPFSFFTFFFFFLFPKRRRGRRAKPSEFTFRFNSERRRGCGGQCSDTRAGGVCRGHGPISGRSLRGSGEQSQLFDSQCDFLPSTSGRWPPLKFHYGFHHDRRSPASPPLLSVKVGGGGPFNAAIRRREADETPRMDCGSFGPSNRQD